MIEIKSNKGRTIISRVSSSLMTALMTAFKEFVRAKILFKTY